MTDLKDTTQEMLECLLRLRVPSDVAPSLARELAEVYEPRRAVLAAGRVYQHAVVEVVDGMSSGEVGQVLDSRPCSELGVPMWLVALTNRDRVVREDFLRPMYPTRPPLTHVAMRFKGQTWSLPRPFRHHDIIRLIVELTGVDSVDTIGDDQGFLDASGAYLTRTQAQVNAELNRQIKSGQRVVRLHSEDLW